MSSSTYEGKEFEQDIMICNPNLDILRNDIEFIFNNVKLKLKLSTLFKDRNNFLISLLIRMAGLISFTILQVLY